MRLATPAGLIVASALLAASARPAESNAIASHMRFESSGTVDGTGVTGPAALRFEGAGAGDLTTGSPFDLGRFVAEPGANATYHYTPFDVTFSARPVDGTQPAGAPSVVLHGWLDGTVRDGDASGVSVIAVEVSPPEGSTLPPYLIPPFRAGAFDCVLATAPGGLGVADPGGSIRLRAVVDAQALLPSPAPEPGTIAVFAAGAGLAWARRRARSSRLGRRP